MVKITFKNVGQGDSIIIEWEDDKKGIGVLDCNIYRGRNSILEYIKSKEIKKIEFIILSHPHHDHFSGILELLNYCKEQNVYIKYFIHTCGSVPGFLKGATKSVIAEKELAQLFKFIKNNHVSMNMNVSSIQSDLPANYIPLSKNHLLKFLSPSHKEITDNISGSNYNFNEESSENNPKANLLSTVIKITATEGYVLLTSDAPKTVLIRIDTKLSIELEDKILLGQSPHHGAKSNHNNSFWKKRNRDSQTPIVFSVGANTYGHVSDEAIDSFLKNDYNLFSTNKVGGLKDEKSKKIIDLLDVFSIVQDPITSQLQGDQVFTFN